MFGEGQTALKVLVALIVVLGLLALAFWLLRRFGGGRLGSAASRGRQPRLAVIDQAVVDGRRRLVLIRRDNVEHLLIIGGPTDVVVEQNILRAATAPREAAALRPAAATDPLPRAVPLGDDSMWPLQPEPAPKLEGGPKLEPASKPDLSARIEPALRSEGAPRPPRPPAVEEPAAPVEPEAPLPLSPLPAARERRPRLADPLAELAEELSRVPTAPETTNIDQRQPPRRAPRLQPAPPAAPTAADAPSADQNLSEMAQRLEAALRRPARAADRITDKPDDVRAREPRPASEAAPGGPEEFAPRSVRLDAGLRRPFRTDDFRPGQGAPGQAAPGQATPKTASEPAAAETRESASPAPSPRLDAGLRRPFKTDEARSTSAAPDATSEPAAAETPADAARAAREARPAGPDAKPAPQKSLYDSLEQEMASLLGRPDDKP